MAEPAQETKTGFLVRPALTRSAPWIKWTKWERQGGDAARLFWGLVVFCTGLLDIVEIWFLASGYPHDTVTLAAATALAFLCLLRLTHVVLRAQSDFVLAAFYLFAFVWMALAPMMQIGLRRGPLHYDYSDSGYRIALLVTFVGIISYEIGHTVGRRRSSQTRNSTPPTTHIRSSVLTWISVFTLPTLIALVLYIGGAPVLFSSRFRFSDAVFGTGDSKASGAIINAFLIVVPFILTLLWMIQARRARLSRPQWFIFAAIGAANLIINNPLIQARFWVATVYLTLLGTLAAKRSDSFVRISVAASLVFLVLIFPFSDVFRHQEGFSSLKLSNPYLQLADKGDFDAFPQLVQSIARVDEKGLAGGRQLAGAIGFMIPRSIWQDKPRDTGTLLGTEAHLGNVNLSAPLWAEGYIDFGFAGVIGYLFALGYAMRVVAAKLGSVFMSAGFAIFLGVYQFVLLRGSLLQSMGITTAILAVILVCVGQTRPANKPHGPHRRWGLRRQ